LKILGTIGLAAVLAVFLTGPVLAAQAPIGLGTDTGFAVLAGSAITNTGPTTITGNVGLSPSAAVSGFGLVTLHGTQYIANAVALKAKNDLVTAYNDAAGRIPNTVVATELGGHTFTAGVYSTQDGTLQLTGTLNLDAEGNPNAVFVFHAASSLTTASGSSVTLSNGAQACNVSWTIGSSATLGTSTSFKGTILAMTSITMTTGATLEGRLLARNGAVTLDTNVITRPACLAAGATPPPTGTTGTQSRGSEPSGLLLLAGLAAAAAFITIRRMEPRRR
jgi:hypothetical protein